MADQCQIDPAQEFSFPEEQCRELIGRILASPDFHRAAKQRKFLEYVVDRALSGCPQDVTEALIGHRVYGRSTSYDAGNDSIVRTEARTLRKRLERYFEGPGIGEQIVVQIPRGGYVPVFSPRVSPPAQAAAPSLVLSPAAQRYLPSRRQLIWLGASAATGAAAALAWRSRSLAGSDDASLKQELGMVRLESSDAEMDAGFLRAKQRALRCVYTGDPVGEWYATRPDGASNVFGMRNVAHQSLGAAVLGLQRHTANMLSCFARSVSRSRDWCGYWVITKNGLASPSSYASDADFGYCLPANFDVLRTCYNQFRWTGDPIYIGQDFLNFYDVTASNYPQTWDKNRDGIMENLRRPRVHASYYQQKPDFLTGADLVAAQYAGYVTYAAMQESIGREGSLSKRLAEEYRNKAIALRKQFNGDWWNATASKFYSGTLADGSMAMDSVPECVMYALLFGIPEDGPKTEAALETVYQERPQFPGAYSYLPEVLYRYDRNDRAYALLMEIAGESFFGKDEGEVAFAVVGTVAAGLMGLAPDAPASTLETLPRLGHALQWARLGRVPVLRNEITVEHRGVSGSTLTNHAGPALQWRVSFPARESGGSSQIVVDRIAMKASFQRGSYRQPVASVVVPVAPGQTRSATYSG